MNVEIRGPRKPRRLERKFRISKRDYQILTHRERARFKTLSYADKKKLNNLYAKVILHAKLVCRHNARLTIIDYRILKGYAVVTHRCLDCHKTLQIDVYKTEVKKEK